MANRVSQLTIALVDRLSGPARQAGQSIDQLNGKARRAARESQSVGAGAGAAVSGIARGVAAVGGVYGAARFAKSAVTDFAELDRRLRRIGITAGATEAEVKAGTEGLKNLAQQSATPLKDVLAGMEALTAQGRGFKEALDFMPSVIRTSQAAGAQADDIAKSADAISTHFKIAGKDIQGAFDVLVEGGKQGQFELKDMARYLPSLAPAAKAVGLEGQKGLRDLVAMLQVIRKGTGTAEEAASSMNNILQKMNSEETRKKFKKMGVDLEAAFKKGKAEGKNLIEVFEDAAWKATKGDLSQLPKLINDMEFARGMRAILSLKGAWQDMSSTIAKNAPGSAMRDFNRVIADTESKLERSRQAYDRLKTSVGEKLADPFTDLMTGMRNLVDGLPKDLQPKGWEVVRPGGTPPSKGEPRGETDAERRARLMRPAPGSGGARSRQPLDIHSYPSQHGPQRGGVARVARERDQRYMHNWGRGVQAQRGVAPPGTVRPDGTMVGTDRGRETADYVEKLVVPKIREQARRDARNAGGITPGQSIARQVEAEKRLEEALHQITDSARLMPEAQRDGYFGQLNSARVLRNLVGEILKHEAAREGHRAPGESEISERVGEELARVRRRLAEPIRPEINTGPLDDFSSKAETAHDRLSALDMKVSPQVGTGSIDTAIDKAQRLKILLAELGTMADGTASRAAAAGNGYSDT